jgi:excinuclease ABC subunit C
MVSASQNQEYERAARLRDKIQAIEGISQKQKVISTKLDDEDVISLVKEKNMAGINLLSIRLGKLIDSKNFILKSVQDLPNVEIVQTFLERYYTQTTDIPKTIILPAKVEGQKSMENWLKLKILIPQKGKKRQLIKMGQENAEEYLKQQKSSWQKEEIKAKKALEEFEKYFKLPQIPKRIEAFDISNIQGQNAVGSMVVFENGLPAKQWYRKFKIKTVKSANDPAMIAEIVQRRLKHLQKDWPRPDLIILDGGKGQLGMVLKKLKVKIPIIALAKQKEDIYLAKQKNPINLPKGSESLFLIQRVRDEAHRFAISFYRKIHTKQIIR